MAWRNCKYCLSILIIMGVVLARQAEAQAVSRYCLAAEDPVFCTGLVKDTRSAVEATRRAVKISIMVAKKMQPYVSKFVASIPKDLPPPLSNTLVDTCNKDYLEILNNYMTCLNYLYSGEIDKLDIELTGLPMEKCLEGVTKAGLDPTTIKKAQDEFTKYSKYIAIISKNVGQSAGGDDKAPNKP